MILPYTQRRPVPVPPNVLLPSLFTQFFSISFAVKLLQNHPDLVSYQLTVSYNDSPQNHSIQGLQQKILCNTGFCVSSFSLSPIGDASLRKTANTFSEAPSARQPKRNLSVKAQWVSPLLAQMPCLSIFSSRYLPSVSVSSPAQAELGFSLGPQSLVCSQLSTSNTGDRGRQGI